MGHIKTLLRNLNYLSKHSLWDQREEDIVYLTKKILDDGIYEYGLTVPGQSAINILSDEESLAMLEKAPKSFVRLGDGEIKIIWGMDQPFQKYEKEIADALIRTINIYREDLYTGINRGYYQPCFRKEGCTYNQRFAYAYRQEFAKYLNTNITYLDACFTVPAVGKERTEELDAYFLRWKKLFADKKLTIICGEGILDNLEYDVFSLAAAKRFLYGPRRHAWNQHHDIIQAVLDSVPKDELIVFILGMAGKAMIPELTDHGYMCWDVGHLAKGYDAYMRQTLKDQASIAQFYAPD